MTIAELQVDAGAEPSLADRFTNLLMYSDSKLANQSSAEEAA